MVRLRVTLGFILTFAAALAVLAQYLLNSGPESFREGVVLLLFAIGALMFLEWQMGALGGWPTAAELAGTKGEAWPEIRRVVEPRAGTVRHGIRLALTGVAVVAMLLSLQALRQHPRDPQTAFAWWLVSLLVLIVAWVDVARIRAWRFEWGRTEVALVVMFVLIGGALRLFNLEGIPQNLGGDEASQGLAAIEFITGSNRDMFNVGWYGVPTMSFFWQSFWFRAFGISTFSLRLPWAIMGTLTILLCFWVLRSLFGTRIALIASFLLATYHFHIHFSRLGSNQVADPFFLLLALGLLLRGIETRNSLYFVLTGALLGISLYFYAGARLAPIWLGATAGLWVLFRPGFWREHRGNLMLAILAFVIVGGPMLLFAVEQPDAFNTRFNQVNIFRSGWLKREISATGLSMWSILADQTRRAVFSFNYYPDRTVWYGMRVPFLNFVGAVLFVLGIGYATAQGTDYRYLPFVLWFWLAVILGGALNESPPSSMRLITLAPGLCLFPTLALIKLGDVLRTLWKEWRPAILSVQLLVVAWLAVSSVWFYFVDYTPKRIYGSTNAEVATVAGHYLHALTDELGSDYRVYFFGLPRMFFGFATIPFLAPGVEGTDVPNPLQGPPTFVDQSRPAVFIFLPHRRADLETVRRYYPRGRLQEFRQEAVDTVLFWAYEVEQTGPAG